MTLSFANYDNILNNFFFNNYNKILKSTFLTRNPISPGLDIKYHNHKNKIFANFSTSFSFFLPFYPPLSSFGVGQLSHTHSCSPPHSLTERERERETETERERERERQTEK